MRTKGIYCLEGLWEDSVKYHSTVHPILELLEQRQGVPHVYHDCATKAEMAFYLARWTQSRAAKFPILYFAFHGSEGTIRLSNHEDVTLDELAALFKRPRRSVIILASCGTLAVHKAHLAKFMKKTGAIAVCGYKADVEWLRSTAFELLLLATLQQNDFSGRGINAIIRKTTEEARRFKELEFRIESAYRA